MFSVIMFFVSHLCIVIVSSRLISFKTLALSMRLSCFIKVRAFFFPIWFELMRLLELLEGVLFADIRFHDTVSRGRLLNRFGKDFEGIP